MNIKWAFISLTLLSVFSCGKKDGEKTQEELRAESIQSKTWCQAEVVTEGVAYISEVSVQKEATLLKRILLKKYSNKAHVYSDNIFREEANIELIKTDISNLKNFSEQKRIVDSHLTSIKSMSVASFSPNEAIILTRRSNHSTNSEGTIMYPCSNYYGSMQSENRPMVEFALYIRQLVRSYRSSTNSDDKLLHLELPVEMLIVDPEQIKNTQWCDLDNLNNTFVSVNVLTLGQNIFTTNNYGIGMFEHLKNLSRKPELLKEKAEEAHIFSMSFKKNEIYGEGTLNFSTGDSMEIDANYMLVSDAKGRKALIETNGKTDKNLRILRRIYQKCSDDRIVRILSEKNNFLDKYLKAEQDLVNSKSL